MQDNFQKYIDNSGILIISKSYCRHSQRAKDAASKAGFSFNSPDASSKNVTVLELDKISDGNALHEKLKNKYGQLTVPYLFVDGSLIGDSHSAVSYFGAVRPTR
jgi:glutaredoxin